MHYPVAVFIAKVVYGIHKPKRLSPNQMTESYQELGYLHQEILIFPDDTAYVLFLDQKKTQINSVFIFNPNGYLVSPKDSMTCSAENKSYLKNYRYTSFVGIDTSFHLSYFKPFNLLGTDTLVNIADNSSKYTVLLCFADFVGRLNKETTTPFLGTLSENPDPNRLIFMLSLDPTTQKKGMIESLPFK